MIMNQLLHIAPYASLLNKLSFTFILLLCLVASAGAQNCDAIVGSNENIQDAIDAAGAHDVICVEQGTFTEQLIIETEGISLMAADENAAPVLSGSGVGIRISEADNVLIRGFEIRNYGKAIEVTQSKNVQIRNNLITENDWAIHDSNNSGSGGAVIRDNTIVNNSVRGIDFQDNTDAEILDNTISDNNGNGVQIGGTTIVRGNTIVNNSPWGVFAYGQDNVIEDNTISGHVIGISLARPQGNRSDGARVESNVITNNDTGISVLSHDVEVRDNQADNVVDIALSGAWRAIIEDNTLETGIVLDVENVRSEAFDHTINNNTVKGGQLFYSKGETNPLIPVDATQVIIYDGTNVNLSGQTFENVAVGIQVGYSDGVLISEITATDIGGQGIGVWGSTNVEIKNSTVTNAALVTDLPAIGLVESPGGLIENNTITENNWNGISILRSPNAEARQNISSNNTRIGIFVANQSNGVLVEDNEVNDNGDVGVRIFSQSENVQIKGNTINGNGEQGIWDGLWNQEPGGVITDNHVENNGREGIYFRSSDAQIINNTVIGNGGIFAGIHAGTSALVQGNTVINNQTNGVSASHDSEILDNLIQDNSSDGIQANARASIIGNTITDNGDVGIRLRYYDGQSVINNTLSGHNGDLFLYDNGDVTVTDNTFETGVIINAASPNWGLEDFTHTFENNTVKDGAPLFHAHNVNNPVIPSDAGQIIIVNSTNVDISGFEFADVAAGIQVAFSKDVTVTGNSVANSTWFHPERGGITIWNSGNVVIEDNTLIENEGYGLEVINSRESHIKDNTITENKKNGLVVVRSPRSIIQQNEVGTSGLGGIEISHSDSIQVIENTAINNGGTGIMLVNSAETLFENNTIAENDGHGIFFESSESPWISQNTVTGNSESGLESHFGFRASNQAHIRDNTIANNGEYGVNFGNGEDITIMDNSITENQNGIIVGSPANVRGNFLHDNRNTALEIADDAEDVHVSLNSISGNGNGLSYSNASVLDALKTGGELTTGQGAVRKTRKRESPLMATVTA